MDVRARIAHRQAAFGAGRGQGMGEQRLRELLLLPKQRAPPLAGNDGLLEALGLVDDLGQGLAGLRPGQQVSAGPGTYYAAFSAGNAGLRSTKGAALTGLQDARMPIQRHLDCARQYGYDQGYLPPRHCIRS